MNYCITTRHGLETIHHIVWQCPIWIRTWTPSSRLLEQLERLDPFADILPFLRVNRLVATFEFADFQVRAQEEIDASGRGGYYCGLLRQLRARAHAWYSAPFEQREQALAAFNAAQDDCSNLTFGSLCCEGPAPSSPFVTAPPVTV